MPTGQEWAQYNSREKEELEQKIKELEFEVREKKEAHDHACRLAYLLYCAAMSMSDDSWVAPSSDGAVADVEKRIANLNKGKDALIVALEYIEKRGRYRPDKNLTRAILRETLGMPPIEEIEEDDGIAKLKTADEFERTAPLGRNGGVACDTRSGPCACGAWH